MELCRLFKNRLQMRLTTGTEGRAEAGQRQHSVAQSIYDKFNKAQQDEKVYDKNTAKFLIEAVAQVIGIKGAGLQPPQEFLIADAMFDKLTTQEIGIPKTDEDEVRLAGAMTALQ